MKRYSHERGKWMQYESLFKTIKLGTLELRNRIVFAPIGIGAYNDDETVNERYFPFIRERAKETALIITQGSRPSSIGGVKIIGCYDDRFIPSLRRFAESAHVNGAKIFLQLVVIGGNDPLGGYAPSALDIPLYQDKWGRGDMHLPKELQIHQIKELVEEFAQGARRAKEAGFDGVEVHAAYGYLISEFICPGTNHRTDEYGGSFEKRMRFPVEIIRRIKEVCSNDFPIGFKFNAHMDIRPEGIDEEMGVMIAQRVAQEGVVYLHAVAMGEDVMYMQLAKYPSMPTMYQPRNTTVSLSANLKAHIKNVPIIAAGGILKPDEADAIVGEGKADLVAVGRALLADPLWSAKAREGGRITPCIKCLVCHHEVVKMANIAACTVNPYLVREPQAQLLKANKLKRVLVAGGGPAGITAAVVASRRGHEVTLYDRLDNLGGQIIAGSKPEFKYEFPDLLQYFRDEIKDSSVRVRLNTEVTGELIKKESPDVLIVAIGGSSRMPDIPGIDRNTVITAPECLKRADEVKKRDVVVIGGGDVGCETAVVLVRRGNSVSIVEELGELMALEDIKYNTLVMERMLKQEEVHVYTGSRVTEIKEKSVVVKNADGISTELSADLVVVSIGLSPQKDKAGQLQKYCQESYVIGDAVEPHRIREAVYEGDRVARMI
jgi:2,4-dienoyl-CoA reductase-like NADH-dependent reductase (Old Yellow Enzyme family)/thioredoxin reductase